MKKIGICNNKGGVGKTTISLCLSGTFTKNQATTAGGRVLGVADRRCNPE